MTSAHKPKTKTIRELLTREIPPIVIQQPSTNEFPGGGEIFEYHDAEGLLVERIYYPAEPAAMAQQWASVIAPSLFGTSNGHMDYLESLADVENYPITWDPPSASDTVKFKLFSFMSTLSIRIWDPKVSLLPVGSAMCMFGLDFVDADGRPQSVGGSVEVVTGERHFLGPEAEGDPVLPIDHVGVPSQFPDRFGVYGGLPYDFYHAGHIVKSHTFPPDLLQLQMNATVTREWIRKKETVEGRALRSGYNGRGYHRDQRIKPDLLELYSYFSTPIIFRTIIHPGRETTAQREMKSIERHLDRLTGEPRVPSVGLGKRRRGVMDVPDSYNTITSPKNASQGRLEADQTGPNLSEGGGIPMDEFALRYNDEKRGHDCLKIGVNSGARKRETRTNSRKLNA
ncbi:hypothetical protein ARMGADRAFT_1035950 [Armillaria gallica]|uniref:Uncharacterized protein n=1 Tax=Armillaria gallica TaxID=47427 RepID=A0A2H3CSC1_ARMGA|nr:hypothetical protein ARMGADRAFT_1035950 [Armillaria gallica]